MLLDYLIYASHILVQSASNASAAAYVLLELVSSELNFTTEIVHLTARIDLNGHIYGQIIYTFFVQQI